MSSSVQCPECGTNCRAGSKFCIQCAFPLGSQALQNSICSRGHKLDPTWTSCPFCKGIDNHQPAPPQAEKVAGQRVRAHTVVEFDDGPSAPITTSPALEPIPLSEVPSPPDTLPPRQSAPGAISPGDAIQQPIAGVLTTFTWRPGGQAWLIRQGRNYIGAARGAQICLPAPEMSPKHAVIAVKGDLLMLDDCLSESGTWLNGNPITQKTMLKHGDVIQTGETLWSFSLITPPNLAMKQILEC